MSQTTEEREWGRTTSFEGDRTKYAREQLEEEVRDSVIVSDRRVSKMSQGENQRQAKRKGKMTDQEGKRSNRSSAGKGACGQG